MRTRTEFVKEMRQLQKKGETAAAEKQLRSVFAHTKFGDPSVITELCQLLRRTDRRDEANAIMIDALKDDPENGPYNTLMGWLHMDAHRWQAASEHFRAFPQIASARAGYAESLARMGEIAAAEALVGAKEGEVEIDTTRGVILRVKKEFKGSKILLRRVTRRNVQFVRAFDELGATCIAEADAPTTPVQDKKQIWSEAVAAFTGSEKIYPDSKRAQNGRLYAEKRMQMLDAAA